MVCGFHLVFSIGLGYALGGAERQKGRKWREVQAVSVTIKQETSARDSTGRVGQRKSGENANAWRLERKSPHIPAIERLDNLPMAEFYPIPIFHNRRAGGFSGAIPCRFTSLDFVRHGLRLIPFNFGNIPAKVERDGFFLCHNFRAKGSRVGLNPVCVWASL